MLLRCGGAPTLAGHLTERTTARLAQAPAVYAPVTPTWAAPAETEALRAAFEASLEPQARARVVHDPALDLAATANAENFSDLGLSPSRPLVQWLLWRSGSVAQFHDIVGGFTGGQSARGHRALQGWTAKAADAINTTGFNTLGYGLTRFTEGRITAQSILFAWAPFDVATFPKTYAPLAPLALTLKPRKPLKEILFLLDRGEAIDERLITPQKDGSFAVSMTAPAAPGRYFIQILGPGPARRTQLWVPIYVGVVEPTAPDAFIQNPPPGPSDVGGWPAWLAATLSAERAKMGKGPVGMDARLTALAQERVADFAANRSPADVESPMFAARLATVGLGPSEVSEIVVTTTGTESVLFELMRPSTRQRLLHSAQVRLGVSAAPRPGKEDAAPSYSVVIEAAVSRL
jgi:hypothetical protein